MHQGDQGLDSTTGDGRGVTVAAGLVDRHRQRRHRAAWAWGLVDRHGHQLDSTGDGRVGDVRQHPAAIGTAGDQGDRLHQGDQGLDSTSDGRVGDVRQHPAAMGAGDQGLDSTSDGRMGDVRQHPAAIGAGDQGLDSTTGDGRGVTVAAGLVDRHGHRLDSTGDGRVGDVRQYRAAIGTAGDQGLDSTSDGAGPRGRGAWSIGTATSSTAPATAAWAT